LVSARGDIEHWLRVDLRVLGDAGVDGERLVSDIAAT
jgi:hypothetical protein